MYSKRFVLGVNTVLMINEELLLYMPNFGLTRYGLSYVPDKFTFSFGRCGYIEFFFS